MQRSAIITTHPSEIRLSSLQLNFRKFYEELFTDTLTFTSSTLVLNEFLSYFYFNSVRCVDGEIQLTNYLSTEFILRAHIEKWNNSFVDSTLITSCALQQDCFL